MMIDDNRPCILVYNPISGHGHLDSWNAMFVGFLLGRGWRVLALTPKPADLQERLSGKAPADLAGLQILPWDIPRRSVPYRLWQRLVRIASGWRAGLRQPSQDANSADPEANYLEPVEFAQRIRSGLQHTKWQPEFIFNMYMDLYRTDAKRWAQFQSLNTLPWAGIRFVPAVSPKEAYYAIPSLSGMCFLDETICTDYTQRLCTKRFAYLPDITDTALPDTSCELVREIKQRARGRKIVFMGGAIGGNKNLARWYELIELADPGEWYFLQIGAVNVASLSAQDQRARDKVLRSTPENLFIKEAYLPDEKTFNDVIRASDVVFAVYRNFTISSNMPGKAAAFDTPILVAEDHLMGKRVTQFGIGRTVLQDNVQMMLAGLSDLSEHPVAPEHFQAYRDAFSTQSLQRNFFRFLDQCRGLIA